MTTKTRTELGEMGRLTLEDYAAEMTAQRDALAEALQDSIKLLHHGRIDNAKARISSALARAEGGKP